LGAVGGSLLAAALGSTWQLDGLLLGTLLLAGIALVLLYCLPPQGTEAARSQE
jgi:hypothetical protein